MHLASAILRFERGSKRHKYRPDKAPAPIYGVMEADHGIVLQDLGIESDRVFVFPQADPQPVALTTSLRERPMDFLFHGTISDIPPEDEFFSQYGFVNPAIRQAALDILDAALSGKEDVYIASKKALDLLGLTLDVSKVAELSRIMSVRARCIRRWRLLSGLTNHTIYFCGNVAESFKSANKNGIYLGPKSFSDVLDLAKNSKIVLNDTINLRNAALMRFHYSMAEGCVLASESNSWFRTEYADGNNIILLEPNADHSSLLRDALCDLNALQGIADAGKAKQAANHQWDHRLEPMLKALHLN